MNEQKISRKDIVKATLLSFKVSFYDFEEIVGISQTLYKFRPQIGNRISKIRGLKDEFASALGVPNVRIIAPMNDGSVGIEVPNRIVNTVYLREIPTKSSLQTLQRCRIFLWLAQQVKESPLVLTSCSCLFYGRKSQTN